MKSLALSLLISSIIALPASAENVPALTPENLETVIGADWSGSLTYLNYQEPFEDVTIPAAIEVEAIENGLAFAYKYPAEPQANSTGEALISADGTSFVGAPIVSNQVLETGSRQVITLEDCEDMGREAICAMTYTFAANAFQIEKMVTVKGESESFRRNEYVFTR